MRDLHQQRAREQQRDRPHARPVARAQRPVLPADVGDDEDVEDHDRARVDDHLGGGDELGAQQQEQRRQPEQVADEREHRVERVAQDDRAERPGEGDDRSEEEGDLGHERGAMLVRHRRYSPAVRSGERSSGSASNISLVKMRSDRL